MLRTHHILGFVTAACLVLGCSKEALPHNKQQAAISTFTTTLPTAEAVSSWAAGDIIGISAYRAGSTTLHAGAGHRPYHTEKGTTFTPLSPEDKIFYPTDGSSLDLVAFYPYKTMIREHEYDIDIRNQSVPKNIDFLYSANAKAQDRFQENSHLVFRHALSKLVIEAKPGTGLVAGDLVGMSLGISGVYVQGHFLLSTGSLQPQGAPDSLGMYFDGLYYQAILLPEALATARLHVRLASGESFDGPLPELNLLPGTRYQYVVSIHKTHIVLQSTNIAPWEGLEDALEDGTTSELLYKEGDFYPHPNDPATAMGVVFWLVPGSQGLSGKILSLNSSEQAWSTAPHKELSANNITSGIANTEIAMKEDLFFQNYHAFLWCLLKGHGWYLPARHELHILREQWENYPKISTALVQAGGEPLDINDSYLCSSESRSSPTDKAESYSFLSKSWPPVDKATPYRVRAVIIF